MYYSEYDKRVLPLVFVVIVLVSAILALILRHRSERVRSIPTAIVAVALILMEFIKQRWNILGEYDPYYLPIHFCSLFVLFIPLAELCGKRFSRIFRPIAVCLSFIVSGAMYVFPYGIIGDACETFGEDFYRTHTFIFHHLIVFYLMLTIALRLCSPRVRDVPGVGAVGLIYSAVALPLAYRLGENYCNFLESVIPQMESFRIDNGQRAYTLLLIVILTVGTMLGSLLYVGIHKLIGICFSGNKKDKNER